MSRQRVSQIETKALTILEKMLTSELIPRNGVAIRPRRGTIASGEKLGNDPKLEIDKKERFLDLLSSKLDPDPEATLRDWHAKLSLSEIAEKLECGVWNVKRLMEDYGISRKRGRKKKL